SGPVPSWARARAQVGRRGALRGMTDSSGPPNAISQEQVRAVEQDLTVSIKGEVRFDNGARAIYSTDASNYRHLPFGVVIPKSTDDVVAAVEACRRHGVPITSRGGGTGLAGQSCNTAVVIDHSKYLRTILDLDRSTKRARVQPGVVLDQLKQLAAQGDPPLTFGPDPSTHDRCTIGGMVGNNACGNHAIQSEFYGPGPRM